MNGGWVRAWGVWILAILAIATVILERPTKGATKAIDLDGNPANGAESQVDMNVLQTFPVQVETKVTNRAVGDSFTFAWPSAGPGGFTSSITPGSTGGVGAVWTWTTNQSVVAFTGGTCDKDVCFASTGGPDQVASVCSLACSADGTTLSLSKGATGGVVLNWNGGTAGFTIYRSTRSLGVVDTGNAIGTSATALSYTDTPPGTDSVNYYVVRGTDCAQRKACVTNADCAVPGDGSCFSRGPFGVPGRSLVAGDVTVSAASLTASLITFFSPRKVVFEVTSTAGGGGVAQTVANTGTSPVTFTIPAYPPGCCPANPDVPHQLRCGDTCVDYLNDPSNCGACGNVCGDGTCCSGGACAGLCDEGTTWCNGECADLRDDNANCGACGNVCGDGTCCNNGVCASLCNPGEIWCNGECVNPQSDNANCGACGNACGDGTCCSAGTCASFCPAGQVWCNGLCVDLQNDSGNCGACGNACGDGTCCSAGACASLCPAGQVWCNGQCVDLQDDNGNCGTCGSGCGDGTCCFGGSCASLCQAGRIWCNEQCVDLQDDSGNCGTCGHVCGDGTCCSAGTCASVCPAGQIWCNNKCVDVQNDSGNCGACGNACGDGTCCSAGACVSECPAGRTFCNGQCVDLRNDVHNCGSCGHDCGPADDECEDGHCERDFVLDHDSPPPIPPVCPNPNQTTPKPGSCPNPSPATPVPGYCPNPSPATPKPGYCPNTAPSTPKPGYCPNPSPTFPHAGVCANSHLSSGLIPGVCPVAAEPSTSAETPTCVIESTTQTVQPGGSATTCTAGTGLYKEAPTSITVCGDGIPGVPGTCNNTSTKITTGTFSRLIPDPSKTVGNAYVTPYAVHVLNDTSNDGLLQPGESGQLLIDVVNAGPMNITQAQGTLSAPSVDLSDDGIVNPVGLTLGTGAASYGTILGTPRSTNCSPPPSQPATNATVFPVSVSLSHPGDTSHPILLSMTGTVNGAPFAMNVPLSLGIAGKCDPTANSRDYDGLDGLSNPMAKLVPLGDPIPMPNKSFTAGTSRPMKLRVTCGSLNLSEALVDPPEIVGLSEATRGELDVHSLNLNSDNGSNPNDPFFRFNSALSGGGQWVYNMRTSLIGTGTFTVRIKIAGRKVYASGFVLQ